MYELLFLIAIITNVIADVMIWKEVKIMRMSHQHIRLETTDMKLIIAKAVDDIKPLLNDHAARLAKALGGILGFYQGKSDKKTEEQVGALSSTVGSLEDLISLARTIPDSVEPKTKFMH